ncbi:hypothetical protein XthCFBP4691_07335 [Xanthomonas theicola]|uniref:Uncharacterized protein n=1 Tax=Xanthomonas theicola TaxID=56464 RepID=A0A2S6ZH15_9XANT|nr:hypothetical protein XthCFBP4691_07335 [Xanthomonas theicola]
MYGVHRPGLLAERAADSAWTTHAARGPGCLPVFAFRLRAALCGGDRAQALQAPSVALDTPTLRALAVRDRAAVPPAQIRGGGYVVDALSAALGVLGRHRSCCRRNAARGRPRRHCRDRRGDLRGNWPARSTVSTASAPPDARRSRRGSSSWPIACTRPA